MNCDLRYLDTSEYVLNILPKFCVQSCEFNIAIPTTTGVLVQELQPNLEKQTNTIIYYKLFIHSSTYMLIEHIESDISTCLFDLPQDSIYFTLFQPALTGNLENIKTNTFATTLCSWSPKKLVGEQSVIATINDGGSLDIYVKIHYVDGIIKFEHIINATDVHIGKYKWKWADKTGKTSRELYDETLRRVSLHLPKVMTWTHLLHHKSGNHWKKSFPLVYCVLIVAYADGRIVFWQFNHISIEKYKEAKLIFMGEYETDMQDVTALHWHPSTDNSGLLIIGDHYGKTIALPVIKLVTNYFDVGEPIVLSESSDMAVDYLDLELKDDVLLIHVIRQAHLSIYVLDKEGTIVQCADYNSANLNITGFQKTTIGTILLTTLTGKIKELKTQMIEHKLHLDVRDIYVNINFNKQSLLGFYMSEHNAIITFITQETGLIYKGPIHIRLISFANLSINAFEIFMEKNIISDCYDLLEFMRLTTMQNKELLCNKVSPDLNYDDLTLPELKKYLCLAKISEAVFDQVETVTNYNLKQSCDIQAMINIKLSVYLLQDIIKELKETGALSAFKREAGHICCTYLRDIVIQKFLAVHKLTNNYVDEILEVLNDCEELQIAEDLVCRICEEPLLGLTCPGGHLDNRCALTMVPIINPKYMCPLCVRYVAEEALTFHEQLYCPICDSALNTIMGPMVPYEFKQLCPDDCVTNHEVSA